MSDYGIKEDKIQFISGSAYLFASGTLSDHITAISASVPNIVAISCSDNFNNKLTKLTTQNAYGIITITSGSKLNSSTPNTRLVLRYTSASFTGIDSSGNETILSSPLSNTNSGLLFSSSLNTRDIIVDIPVLNNDDAFAIAYKTVNSLQSLGSQATLFSASLIDDGSSMLNLSSSLGNNMNIGTTFKIRSASSEGTTVGRFKITSLNSGSVTTPDFSGTEVQVGGMQIGSSFMVGGGSGSQTFDYNIIQEGSGKTNQPFFEGNFKTGSSALGVKLDPLDKTSGIITGSGAAKLYLSGSGKIGIGTTNPTVDIEIVSDEIKFKKKSEEVGIKMNDEGNFESFASKTAGAATGSELILKFTRDNDIIGNPGDVLGSIRWVSPVGTLDERQAGESAFIKSTIVGSQEEGVISNLIFGVAAVVEDGPTEIIRIRPGGTVDITGSLNVTGEITSVGESSLTTINGGSF